MEAKDKGSEGQLRETVTRLIQEDPCDAKCLRGRASALEMFVSSQVHLTPHEKKVCVMTSLALLFSAVDAQPQRVRSAGIAECSSSVRLRA